MAKQKKNKRQKRSSSVKSIATKEDAALSTDTPDTAVAAAADTTTETPTPTLSNLKPNFFSPTSFSALESLSPSTLDTLTNTLQVTTMTHIQAQAIPPALCGKDIVACAETGSGKTLAFLIPCLEVLRQSKFTTSQGTGVMVLSPTRELALQIFGVLSELMGTTGTSSSGTTSSGSGSGSTRHQNHQHHHHHTYGLIMGGANRRTEAEKLSRGVNILICTPGRILDHLQNTRPFKYSNLLALVMDEADRILEQGFADDLRAILKLLPTTRQTLLFSATQTKQVSDLIRLSMDPQQAVTVEVERTTATAANIEQGYVTVPSAVRFRLLFTFLKKNMHKKKLMVFFSSCNSVKFHAELLNYIDIPVTCIHGRQKQVQRTTSFFDFCQRSTGILLCTDVAARGWDIPAVDWIVQFDPPDDPVEYIHRVGRTARGATGKGRALLFLTPHETAFLKYLKTAGVSLQEFEFAPHKIANIQPQLERVIESNYYLNRAARDAFRSYLLAYASHGNRAIFNVHQLDLQGVGTAFGFRNPPRVDIGALGHGKRKRKQGQAAGKQTNFSSSGHAFSAENPYGKRDATDTRQFTH